MSPALASQLAEGPPLFLMMRPTAGSGISRSTADDELVVNMVRGNEQEYDRYEFNIQGGGFTPPEYAIQYYIHVYSRTRDTLRASFGFYRAWGETSIQNKARAATPITIPVLGIGGEKSWGNLPGDAVRGVATDVADRRHSRCRGLARGASP